MESARTAAALIKMSHTVTPECGSRVPIVSVWIVVILDVADNLYVYLRNWNPQSAVCERLSIRQNTANYDVNKPEKSGLWLFYARWNKNVVYEQSLH